MKIIFPTDFSNAAENGYIYALRLADKLNAQITVIHIYQKLEMHTWIEESVNMKEINEKIALGEFERFKSEINLLKRIASEHHLDHIDINYSLKESSNVVEAVLSEARKENFDLIVIGTKGASGLREIFFGSVASKVMEKSPCPVFVIPDTANYRGIEKIGLTLDYKPGERELINLTLGFCRRLQAHLHCLHVDAFDPEKNKVKMKDFENAFQSVPDISFHIHHNLNIEQGILDFMKVNQMDVIVMRVHHHSLLKELFSYSIARRIAYHTDIPLLALHVEDQH